MNEKYEYQLSDKAFDTEDEFIEWLNILGDKGWELVHINYRWKDSQITLGKTYLDVYVILKREKL